MVSGFNINGFRENGLRFGGARPSQFEVLISPPDGIGATIKDRLRFLVHAASLPAFQINPVGAPYFGATIKYAGDRTYSDWTVAVLNDEDFAVRSMLENWSNEINALISNRMNPDIWPNGYKTSAVVYQKGKDGKNIRAYRFEGIWPSSIDQIPLAWGSQSQMEEFGVTFCLDYFEPANFGFGTGDIYNPQLQDDDQVGNVNGSQAVLGNGIDGATPPGSTSVGGGGTVAV